MKCQHSLPMDISRTEIYYTHQPIFTHILLIKVVNDSASDTSCWWNQRRSRPMISIDYHNSCETPTTFKLNSEAVIPEEEVLEAFLIYEDSQMMNKKWRSFVNSNNFNPKERWNITLCGKLRWIPPRTVSAATFVSTTVNKMNQTPRNCKSQIQSWMFWFQDQYKKYLPKCSFKVKSWRKSDYWRWSCLCEDLNAIDSLLPSLEGRDCYMRKIVGTPMQRWHYAIISMPWRDREKIKESYKPSGRLLGLNCVVYTLLLLFIIVYYSSQVCTVVWVIV